MGMRGIVMNNEHSYISETLVTHKSSGDKGIVKRQIILDNIKN